MTIATEQTLRPGPRGQDGRLAIHAALIGDRTRLLSLRCQAPLQVLRAAYTEPELPGLASVTICSPAGGVLQGDRLRIELALDAGAELRLETQSATRLYAMPDGSASGRVSLKLGPGSFLEYVPDPLIPFAGAAYRQESAWEVDESATLIAGEVVTAGREARGETARYQRVELEIGATRPGGQMLFSDSCVLVPDDGHQLGFLGGHTTLGSLFVVSSTFRAAAFAALGEHPAVAAGYAGWSDLPNDAGAWFKVLAHDSATAIGAVQAAWETARRVILGADLPPKRRF
jgi:urease accessory protein